MINVEGRSVERLTLTVVEAAKALGIGRSAAYELCRQQVIPCIKFGKKILVPRKALEAMLEDWKGLNPRA